MPTLPNPKPNQDNCAIWKLDTSIEFQLWGTMWAILKPKGNMSSLAVGKGGLLTLLVFLSIFLSPQIKHFACTPTIKFVLKWRFIFACSHTLPELVFSPLWHVRWQFRSIGEGTPADPAYCCLTNTVSSLFITAYKNKSSNSSDNTDLH